MLFLENETSLGVILVINPPPTESPTCTVNSLSLFLTIALYLFFCFEPIIAVTNKSQFHNVIIRDNEHH